MPAGRPPASSTAAPDPPPPAATGRPLPLLDADPAVKVILVSVFGGGTHMDRVASANRDILPARTSTKPVVSRLDGTHVDQVDGILADFGARNHPSLESAVAEAVKLAREAA